MADRTDCSSMCEVSWERILEALSQDRWYKEQGTHYGLWKRSQ